MSSKTHDKTDGRTDGRTLRVSQSAEARRTIDALASAKRMIPGFAQLTIPERRKLLTKSAIPNDFLEAVAVMVDGSPTLAAACELDTSELREVIAFSVAYEAVAREADAIAQGTRDTILVRRSAVVAAALRAYTLAKGLGRGQDQRELADYVGAIKPLLRRGRPRRTTPPLPPHDAGAPHDA